MQASATIGHQDKMNITYNLLFLCLVSQTRAPKRATSLLKAIERFFDPLDILQPKLSLYDLHVTQRIYVSLYMYHFRIVERTDDLEDTIDGADV
jgi:hypothetical protein